MFKNIDEFLDNPSINNEFGDWKKLKNFIDPFMDGKGSERIGKYFEYLFKGFKNDLSDHENIIIANKKYNSFVKKYKASYKNKFIFTNKSV